MPSDYPTLLQIAPIPLSSTKLQHTRLQGIVTSLTELGYDSIVCSYAQSKDLHGAENLRTTFKHDIRTHEQLEKSALSTHLKLTLLCINTFRVHNPIAIHAYGFRGLKISAIVKACFFWKQTPIICDLSDSEVDKLKKRHRFSLSALLMKMANVVICSSQNSLEVVQRELALDSAKAALVVSGINSYTQLSDDRIETIRQKLKIDESRTVIAVNGGLEKGSTELKELQKIIHSFKKMSDQLHFLIIGEPKKYLYSFLKKYELRSMCSLVGDVPEKLLPKYYSVTNLALCLDRSNNDDNRINILNFMANALPVVCYETKLQTQYLAQNSPFSSSISDLRNALKDLHYNRQWQIELADQNYQQFEEFYSWEVSKEQLHATYSQVLEE